MAEASSTILFFHGCPASLRNQGIGKQPPRFDELSQALPELGKPALQCRDANLVVLNAQVNFIYDLQTKSGAERRPGPFLLSGCDSKLSVGHILSCATTITSGTMTVHSFSAMGIGVT